MDNHSLHVVFDLDDTLYRERDYVESAFMFLGRLIERTYGIHDFSDELTRLYSAGDPNPIATIWDKQDLPASAMAEAVAAMRAHLPDIDLRQGARETLCAITRAGVGWSILTNGRSMTQRQKIAALGLQDAWGVYISAELGVSKPDPAAFEKIRRDFCEAVRFVYVGDNPAKDFIAPNRMGWQTVMLNDDGFNIHTQEADLPSENKAQFSIRQLPDLCMILDL